MPKKPRSRRPSGFFGFRISGSAQKSVFLTPFSTDWKPIWALGKSIRGNVGLATQRVWKGYFSNYSPGGLGGSESSCPIFELQLQLLWIVHCGDKLFFNRSFVNARALDRLALADEIGKRRVVIDDGSTYEVVSHGEQVVSTERRDDSVGRCVKTILLS